MPLEKSVFVSIMSFSLRITDYPVLLENKDMTSIDNLKFPIPLKSSFARMSNESIGRSWVEWFWKIHPFENHGRGRNRI